MAPDSLHDALDTLVARMAVTDPSHGEITLTWPETPKDLRLTLTLDIEIAGP